MFLLWTENERADRVTLQPSQTPLEKFFTSQAFLFLPVLQACLAKLFSSKHTP